MNVIEFRLVSKKYSRGKLALDELNLQVPGGSFFGFVGPNGAGKSTTANLIAGLIRKNSGSIRIFGNEIKPGSFHYRSKIGFVLEKPFFMEKLTGEEYLRFAGQMYDLKRETLQSRLEELLDFFNLKHERKKLIQDYSAGMKKKISLAAALIHGPEILILDEPFESVDAVSATQIKENLRYMTDRGGTVFLTSHVLDIVEKLCDRVAIINEGKLIFQCPTDSIKTRFKDREMKQKYSGLEELFINLVAYGAEKKSLSWLRD
jgi:ABC-2 type transport system ATP-binding protein